GRLWILWDLMAKLFDDSTKSLGVRSHKIQRRPVDLRHDRSLRQSRQRERLRNESMKLSRSSGSCLKQGQTTGQRKRGTTSELMTSYRLRYRREKRSSKPSMRPAKGYRKSLAINGKRPLSRSRSK